MHGFSPFFDSKVRKIMATTKKTIDSTISVEKTEKKPVAPAAKVSVFIPMSEEGEGAKFDQNEYVTVNGSTTKVPRGEWVEVTVPVFVQLRNRYPNL